MRCVNPYLVRTPFETFAVPCRKCNICRQINKQDWSVRLELEALSHENIAFVTLTYSEANLPKTNNGIPTLNYTHIQLFLKRLRKNLDYKIRFFCCGEYGARTNRPHYHLIIFGLKQEDFTMIDDTWTKGMVQVGKADIGSFKYVTGYVNKKFDKYLGNSETFPEFIRFSMGLGRDVVSAINEQIASDKIIRYKDLIHMPDISNTFILNGKEYPFPRYIKNKLRNIVFNDEYIGCLKESTIKAMQRETNTILEEHLGFLPRDSVKELYVPEAYANKYGAFSERLEKSLEIRKLKRKI